MEGRRLSRKKKKKHWSSFWAVFMSIIIVSLGSYVIMNALHAKAGAVEKPIMLSEIQLTKEKKIIPQEYNGRKESKKVVYLTFDDGPTLQTPKLLQILEREKIQATFFLIGNNIPFFPDAVTEMVRKGDYVGMHSMTHQYDVLYKKNQLIKEMVQEQGILKNMTGHAPTLFRGPYGSKPGMNVQLRNEAKKAGLKTWDWTVDSLDWKHQQNPQLIVAEVKKQLRRPVEVVLLHDKPGTIAVLPQIIKVIRDAGYTFKVYDEKHHFPVNFWNDKGL